MRDVQQRSVVVAPVAATGAFDAQDNDAPGISLAQVFSILRAHVRLALVIGISIIAVTALVAKLLPRVYEATATMIVSYQVSTGGTEMPAWMIGTYIATQIELMRSVEVLLPVVDQLGLTSDPEFDAGFRGGDNAALRNFAAATLDKHLTVEQGRGSQLLYVTALSRSPVKAALIANTVADVYSARERQRLKDPADERARNYAQQLTELQAKVMAAQQKVTELRQKTGTSPVSTENSATGNDADMQSLVALEQQLFQAQNMRRAAESTTNIAAIGSGGAGAASPQIQELRAEIVAKELQLSQMSATYGAHHPKVLELQSDLRQARQNLKEESSKYVNDTRQIEEQLQRTVDAQREKILTLRKVQDQGAKIELELESAQAVYKRALEGYDQILFQSSGNPTNVSFVSRAPIPVMATKPNKIKFLLLGTVLGIFFGISFPVIFELLFDRRLHCRDDFERNFRIPVLAEFGSSSAQLVAVPK